MAQAIFNAIDNNSVIKEISQVSEKFGNVNFQEVLQKKVDKCESNNTPINNNDNNQENKNNIETINNLTTNDKKINTSNKKENELLNAENKITYTEEKNENFENFENIQQLIKETCSNEAEIMNDVISIINITENTIPINLSNEIDTKTNEIENSDELNIFTANNDFSTNLNAQNLNLKNNITSDLNNINVVQIEEAVSDVEYKQENFQTNDKTLKDIVEEKVLKELNVESIETETTQSEENELSFMQQSPEEQSIKLMIHNDIDFSEIKTNIDNSNNQVLEKNEINTISPSKIIEQITKQMENINSSSKVNIVLNPESLGKVVLQLAKSSEGLSAQFTVATNEAKEILMKNIESLKENLLAQGVSVDNVNIKMNDTQKSEYNQDWTEQENSNSGNKQNQKENQKQHKNNFEEIISQEQEENGKV